MNKKITLIGLFLLVGLFVKAQISPVEYSSGGLTEEIIIKQLDKSRKSGTQEWEIQKLNQLLHKQLIQQNTNTSSRTPTTLPQPNTTGCVNPGFENGTNSNWNFSDADINLVNLPCNTCPAGATAINNITTSTSTFAGQCTTGVDIYGNFPTIAPAPLGGTYSLLLNNAAAGGKMQEAKYTFAVTAANTAFTFQYAVVLQSGGHPTNEQPYFHVDASSSCSGIIPCTEYEVNAPSSGALNGWSISSADASVYYLPWRTVNIDLSGSIGCNVTISFLVSDCNQGGHFGYAYIDASCSPNQITLTKALCQGGSPAILSGPPGEATYAWTGPVTGNAQNLSTSTPGSYTLATTSLTGCPSPNLFYTLTLNPAPVPSFTATSAPCSGNETFTDGSTVSSGTIANWQWNFGDGSPKVNSTTGTVQTHSYNPPGNYVVTLTDSTAQGCFATYDFTVAAGGGGPTATFSSNSTAAAPQCFSGNNVVFTNTSSATGAVTITGYLWNFGDGSPIATSTPASPNTSHSYTSCGTFVTTLTVTATGCNATSTQTVVINPSPTASFSVAPVCKGNPSIFASTIASVAPCTSTYTYAWDFGDAAAGTSAIANPSYTYTTATGSPFAVSLTVTAVGGCSVTTTYNAIVNPLPTAAFSVTQVCQGTGSVFTNTSTLDSACTWNFGGAGNPATASSICAPTYTYSASGTFPAILTVTAVGGCTATATANAVVNPMPTLGFTTADECDQTAVPFVNTTASQGTFTVWAWDFGDGIGTSAVANPGTYTYPAPGVYTSTLTATTATGCSGTVTATTNVHPNPVFNGEFTQPCFGDLSSIYDLSTLTNPPGINDALTNWNWNFGDGFTTATTVDSANHTYALCGTYTISYTVSTNFNCSVSGSASDTVFCLPIVTAPPSFSICPGMATAPQTFTSTVGNGGPAVTVWFTNYPLTNTGMTITDTSGLNVFPSYPTIPNNLSCNPLSDMVYGIAVSNYCIGNEDSLKITVYPTPYLSHMDSIKVCANQQVVVPPFTACPATSTVAWTNNTTSIGLAASGNGNVTSPFTGLNTTTLAVYALITATPSANACVGPDSTFVIAVSPLPTITVTPQGPYCPGDNIASPVINMPIGTLLGWTVSNASNIGMTTPGSGIPFPYIAPANATLINQTGIITYTPALNGCIGTPETGTITIKPTPVIQAITSLTYCPGNISPQINYTCLPTGMGNPNYNWQITTNPFNVGLTPTTASGDSLPAFTAAVNNTGVAQMATVTLGASLNNCPSAFSNFNIIVNPTPSASFSAAPVCDGQATNFVDLSTPNSGTISVTNWSWDMNNDGIYDVMNQQNPSYTVTPAGQDPIKLFVSTNSVPSCSDTITLNVTVNANPIPNFVADTLSGCPILSVTFTDLSSVAPPSTITSYVWSFGAGAVPQTATTSLPTNQGPIAYNNTTTIVKPYTVSYTVTTNAGCTAVKTKTAYINVSPKPIADFDWGPKNADIDDPTITFFNQAIGASPYLPVLTYGQYGVHYYLGDTHAYDANSNYVDNNTTFTHVYNYSDTATYYVTQWVINSLGCKDSITKPVKIGPDYTFYIPNAFSPNGDGTNEGFKGTGIGIKDGSYNLWVFDRWGNVLFYSDELEKAWDGHMQGNDSRPILQEDVYVWKVKFTDITNKSHDFHGTVTLVK